MSRVDYSEDEDFPGQRELQQANMVRLLAGKKGQAILRDLEAALLELPQKRLIANHGAKDGEVCAVAALAVYREARSKGQAREQVLRELEAREREYLGPDFDSEEWGDDEWTLGLGESVGVPHSLAWRLVALNDLDFDHCTAEQRYEKVLAWTQRHLARGIPPIPERRKPQ